MRCTSYPRPGGFCLCSSRRLRLRISMSAEPNPAPSIAEQLLGVLDSDHSSGLHVGGMSAESVAERFGTPCYVYDAGVLRRPLHGRAGRPRRRGPLRDQGQSESGGCQRLAASRRRCRGGLRGRDPRGGARWVFRGTNPVRRPGQESRGPSARGRARYLLDQRRVRARVRSSARRRRARRQATRDGRAGQPGTRGIGCKNADGGVVPRSSGSMPPRSPSSCGVSCGTMPSICAGCTVTWARSASMRRPG